MSYCEIRTLNFYQSLDQPSGSLQSLYLNNNKNIIYNNEKFSKMFMMLVDVLIMSQVGQTSRLIAC